MHQLIGKASYSAGTLSKQIANTVMNAIFICIQGVTGADKDAAIALIYSGLKIKAVYTPGPGAESTPFVSSIFLDEFQEINEVYGGALQQTALSNGAFIELGGSVFLDGDAKVDIDLDWSAVDLSGLTDAVTTGATVQIHRIYNLPAGGFDGLRVYYGKDHSAAQQEHIPPVPNCDMILFKASAGITDITLAVGGRDIDLDVFVLQQMTNYAYEHEESGDAPFVALWSYGDGDPPDTKVTVTATAGDRVLFVGTKDAPELTGEFGY